VLGVVLAALAVAAIDVGIFVVARDGTSTRARAPSATSTLGRTRSCRPCSWTHRANALALAYGEGAVWVACGDSTVVRVDPKTGRAGPAIDVGALPRGIAAADGAVWVTLN
jgi:streptogramin lyase